MGRRGTSWERERARERERRSPVFGAPGSTPMPAGVMSRLNVPLVAGMGWTPPAGGYGQAGQVG